jgi:DNA-binding MarR family transcriptional regulator
MSADHPRRSGSSAGWTTFLITQLGSLAATHYAERLSSLGLNPAHTGLLRLVATEPGRSQQSLAAELGLLPSRLVALTDELEERGLVERRRNPDDRRLYALHLTATGESTMRDVGRLVGEHGQEFLAPLPEEERETLNRLLCRLAEHHRLTPGVHPGYSRMGRAGDADQARPHAG